MVKPFERLTYCLCGVNPELEQSWKGYTVAMLIFSLVTMMATFVLLRLQAVIPLQHLLNPQGLAGVPDHLAFNTAASFYDQHRLAKLQR